MRAEHDGLGGTSLPNDTFGCRGVDAASLNGGGAIHANLTRGDDPPGSSAQLRLAEDEPNTWRPALDRSRESDAEQEDLEGSAGDGEARGGSSEDQPPSYWHACECQLDLRVGFCRFGGSSNRKRGNVLPVRGLGSLGSKVNVTSGMRSLLCKPTIALNL